MPADNYETVLDLVNTELEFALILEATALALAQVRFQRLGPTLAQPPIQALPLALLPQEGVSASKKFQDSARRLLGSHPWRLWSRVDVNHSLHHNRPYLLDAPHSSSSAH